MTFCLGVSSNFPSLEYHNTRPVPHLSTLQQKSHIHTGNSVLTYILL